MSLNIFFILTVTVKISENLYQSNNNNSINLFLHMNISLFSYHIDDLNTFIMNCKNKPIVFGNSERRIKADRLLKY